jgi:hypothetical protein
MPKAVLFCSGRGTMAIRVMHEEQSYADPFSLLCRLDAE